MSLSVTVIETSELGDRSYVVHDGGVAVVVDPQRDLDRVEQVLADVGVRCELVLETHIHNDYVTGGYELARRTGARYVVAAADDVAFARDAVSDGDQRTAGTMRMRCWPLPGTPTPTWPMSSRTPPIRRGPGGVHRRVAALRQRRAHRPGRSRPNRGADPRAVPLRPPAGRRCFRTRPRSIPTHGFGSFCSSGSSTGGDASTIGTGTRAQRRPAWRRRRGHLRRARLIAGLTAYPALLRPHGARRNRRARPLPTCPRPSRSTRTSCVNRINAGEWVVDLRDRTAYAAEHLAGTIGIALGQQFSTYLGWLVPWGAPLTLVGENPEQVTDAQRQLVRIGIDRPAGRRRRADPTSWPTPDELRRLPDARPSPTWPRHRPAATGPVVLDVRRDDERVLGVIPGSTHIPLHSLLQRLSEVPDGQLWVHCAAGYRASIAASLLDRAGHDVVLVDDDFSNAVESGLAMLPSGTDGNVPAQDRPARWS